MKSKWKIAIDGFEAYRFGEDGNLYKLPYSTHDGQSRGVRLIKKDSKKRWNIIRFGRKEKWGENQLRQHLILDDSPVIITKTDNLPF